MNDNELALYAWEGVTVPEHVGEFMVVVLADSVERAALLALDALWRDYEVEPYTVRLGEPTREEVVIHNTAITWHREVAQ